MAVGFDNGARDEAFVRQSLAAIGVILAIILVWSLAIGGLLSPLMRFFYTVSNGY